MYCESYCEEKGISTSELNEAQRTLYYIAENMKMEKSISEDGYKHFQMAIKAIEQEPCEDAISRQAAIDKVDRIVKVNHLNPDMVWFTPNGVKTLMEDLPSAEPEVIHCCDCVYYDPEHIEKDGVRYDYKDMPKDAFDILGTGLVNLEYGINVGGRCCRDYNVGYSEDKRVFVSKQNYCGRAERRTDE